MRDDVCLAKREVQALVASLVGQEHCAAFLCWANGRQPAVRGAYHCDNHDFSCEKVTPMKDLRAGPAPMTL